MLKKILIVITILAAGAAIALFFAGRRHHPMNMEQRTSFILNKLSGELQLDEPQRKTAEKIGAQIMEKMKAGRQDEGEITKALAEQVSGDKIDQDKPNKFLNNKRKGMDEMRKFLISKLSEFHAVLTKEQRVKFAAIIKEGKLGGGFGGHGRNEPPPPPGPQVSEKKGIPAK